MTTTGAPATPVGDLLRRWRRERRLSQLEVSTRAAVSARHLSFVETGRSRPSRELVLHLAEHLAVPLRERNDLLLAAGYAPVYAETPLDADELAPVQAAIELILAGHEPFPALVVDRWWDLVSANAPAMGLLAEGVDPALLTNVLRASLHPDGLAPRIENLDEWADHLLGRLDREAAAAGDARLAALAAELRSYPGVPATSPGVAAPARQLFVPLVVRTLDGVRLSLLSTVATFGTARDVTVAELSIESFFPADETTAEALRRRC